MDSHDREIAAAVLKSLHSNMVNEFENHQPPSLDLNDSAKAVFETLLTTVKSTHNEYCKPCDRL